MDNLNEMHSMCPDLREVIALIMDCGLIGSCLTIQVDTDLLPSWGMYIRNESAGTDYHLSTCDNGGYLLQAQVAVPQALVTSGPQGVIGITRDPEEGICQVYLPVLDRDTLMRSLQALRLTIKKVKQMGAPMNHNQHNQN